MTTLYRLYGQNMTLLYVGITDDYLARMRQHSEKSWWSEVRLADRQEFPTRMAAADAERIAIANENPKHNKAGATKRAKPAPAPRVRGAARRLVSQQEAAEYLGVSDRTIRNYIARGDLLGYRVTGSRLVRIDLDDCDALLRPIPSAIAGL